MKLYKARIILKSGEVVPHSTVRFILAHDSGEAYREAAENLIFDFLLFEIGSISLDGEMKPNKKPILVDVFRKDNPFD